MAAPRARFCATLPAEDQGSTRVTAQARDFAAGLNPVSYWPLAHASPASWAVALGVVASRGLG
jgi:hypothetical protein